MKKSAQLLFSFAKDSHEQLYIQLGIVRKEIQACRNMVELADYAYAVDRAHDLVEDVKKELWKLREECNRSCCLAFIASGTQENNLKTDYVTATPDIKMSVGIPSAKTNPEGYKKLLEYLGISYDLMTKDVVRPHWPGLVDFVSSKLAAGEAIPEDCGINLAKQSPIYKLTLRKRKGVLDETDPADAELQERF